MSFFTYRQNNSGGSFDIDHDRGIDHFVIIEADSASDADEKAQRIGLYWDGCESGIDCPCCGDRWNPISSWDEHPEPCIYEGKPVAFGPIKTDSNTLSVYCGFVHFKNGDVKSFEVPR